MVKLLLMRELCELVIRAAVCDVEGVWPLQEARH